MGEILARPVSLSDQVALALADLRVRACVRQGELGETVARILNYPTILRTVDRHPGLDVGL